MQAGLSWCGALIFAGPSNRQLNIISINFNNNKNCIIIYPEKLHHVVKFNICPNMKLPKLPGGQLHLLV